MPQKLGFLIAISGTVAMFVVVCRPQVSGLMFLIVLAITVGGLVLAVGGADLMGYDLEDEDR